MDLIKQLQTVVAPQVFTPRAVYDGRKNIFAARELPFGETGIKEERVLSSFGTPSIHTDTYSLLYTVRC
jgi:eukaryotic translation initiation factor 2C